MRKHKAFLPALLLAALCAGCGTALDPCTAPEHTASFFAMDTIMDLTAYGENGQQAVERAEALIYDLESLLSVTNENSEIYRANHSQTVTLSPHTAALLSETLDVCASTGGALDLTIYPLVRAWGFTTGDYRIPSGDTIAQLLPKVDYRQVRQTNGTLTLPQGVELDLGAAAKGYAGDQVIELFREQGITSGIITLGGNVQVLGSRLDGTPWRVGIRAPDTEQYACAGLVRVTDKAVVTSGGYERYFEQDGQRYCHILDPATGYPAGSGLASVTIVSQSGTLADCLSTALYVMGRDRAIQYWRDQNGSFDFVLIGDDGTVSISQGLRESFVPDKDWKSHKLEVITL